MATRRGYTLGMSWLARLMGRAPAAPAGQAAATVVVPPDLAERLASSGTPLEAAVEAVLREHLAEQERPAEPPATANGDKPFWLTRDEDSGDLEERLRDRIAQRRSSEGEAER